jgi:hypothetical protein
MNMPTQPPIPQDDQPDSGAAPISRRSFLGSAGAVVAGGALIGPPASAAPPQAAAGPFGSAKERRRKAYVIRVDAAEANYLIQPPPHPNNGDEERYTRRWANFTKALPHNAFGEVDLAAYDALLKALGSEAPDDFEAIPHGCPDPNLRLKLVNPQSGLAFDMEGMDSHALAIPPAPTFDSAEEAGEIVENYWMALLRDVPFTEYTSHPLAQAAAADLSAMSDFRGPKVGGVVTPDTLFREGIPGTLSGPLVSQFFWRSQPFGAQQIEPRIRTRAAGVDHLTQAAEWLSVQNGITPASAGAFDPTLRYIRSGRDLGEWVHVDVLFQAYFQALLVLMTPPDPSNPFTGGGLGAPLNPGNPYLGSKNQTGFGTFGGPFFATILCEIATRALKAVWFQKWFVHRRLRPEEFAGRIHYKLVGGKQYPIHADALGSAALNHVYGAHGTYFLPMAFPEGCPIHPAYGAGHGTVAGACVTILKALFDGSYVIPNPVVPTPDGLALVPYTGPDVLTVEGELNKLATNVAMGRNLAGVHWRTDARASLKLGEEVALCVLRDQRHTYSEKFAGFTFNRFDGTPITV